MRNVDLFEEKPQELSFKHPFYAGCSGFALYSLVRNEIFVEPVSRLCFKQSTIGKISLDQKEVYYPFCKVRDTLGSLTPTSEIEIFPEESSLLLIYWDPSINKFPYRTRSLSPDRDGDLSITGLDPTLERGDVCDLVLERNFIDLD